MKLKVVAKPNGNVTFDVDNDSQFDGFDITITPSRLYASYGFYSDEIAAKKQLCAKIYNYCVGKHETDYYFFKNYMKNITYFSYNSKGEVIRVANDVDWCLGQDIKRVNMKEYKHVAIRECLHIQIWPNTIDVEKVECITTKDHFQGLWFDKDHVLHVKFLYDKDTLNTDIRNAVDIANHTGIPCGIFDVIYHFTE